MEMFELKYFLAVAQVENINRAAEIISVSSGSLSKAISRLEDELQTPLFFKSGRGIRLTPEGLRLKARAAHILQLEEDVRLELTGKGAGHLNVYVSSEEILQTSFGLDLLRSINTQFQNARTQFLIRGEQKAIEQVSDGEAHLAIITSEPPLGFVSKVLAEVNFRACASMKHPLFDEFQTKESIPIEAILKYPFVSPDSAILGKITNSKSVDGWRDEQFPRQIKYKVCGLKLMEDLIGDGLALGYLPDYFIERAELVPINIFQCPFECRQVVRIVAKDPIELRWLNQLWSQLGVKG